MNLQLLLIECDPAVVGIAEAWLCSAILDSEVVPLCCTVFGRDRETGGDCVAIAVKDFFSCVEFESSLEIEYKWCFV